MVDLDGHSATELLLIFFWCYWCSPGGSRITDCALTVVLVGKKMGFVLSSAVCSSVTLCMVQL